MSVMLKVPRLLGQPAHYHSGRRTSRATVLTAAWVGTGPVGQQAGYPG